MEQLKNLSAINTNCVEGRLLMAALAKITTESQTNHTPHEVLHQCHELAEHMYKDALPIPEAPPQKTFMQKLEQIINQESLENDADTPDFIIAEYLSQCLTNLNNTIKARDKWFGLDVWANNQNTLTS